MSGSKGRGSPAADPGPKRRPTRESTLPTPRRVAASDTPHPRDHTGDGRRIGGDDRVAVNATVGTRNGAQTGVGVVRPVQVCADKPHYVKLWNANLSPATPPFNRSFDQQGLWQNPAHAKATPSSHRHSCGHSLLCGIAVRRRDQFGRAAELRQRTILGSDHQYVSDAAPGGRLWTRPVLEPVVQRVPSTGRALVFPRAPRTRSSSFAPPR